MGKIISVERGYQLQVEILPKNSFSTSKMKFACAAILLISVTQLTFARTISNGAELDMRELVENLRDTIIMNEKKAMEAKKEDFEKIVTNAKRKVDSTYGKKEETGLFGGPSHEDRVKYKQEIVQWRNMVHDFGIENDPEIKQMAAQMDAMWVALDLDNV